MPDLVLPAGPTLAGVVLVSGWWLLFVVLYGTRPRPAAARLPVGAGRRGVGSAPVGPGLAEVLPLVRESVPVAGRRAA